ncbi:MAG: MCE family protein, partial [Rhodococcus sp. (in: high G+C Gram-positive bacteria)]|uniref:MCE family protein n=1 Tax=Rhodococcus sp. TaxID=1831 RepID=UPI003BAF44DC
MRKVSGAGVLIVLLCAGCEWNGVNSLPLPGTEGRGGGAYTVQIEMPDVSTVDRNSRVRVGDVTVGRVVDLELSGEHALVTVSINGDVQVPANSTAKVGQTSLLGSTHIELVPPITGPAVGELGEGGTIPLERAGSYPTTEQTLSSLALVLGGGGIDNLGDITAELGTALSGREDSVRSLLTRLDVMLGALDDQRHDITAAMEGLDRLAAEVSARNQVVTDALDTVAPALEVLNRQRGDLIATVEALGLFGETASRVVDSTGNDLQANLHDLEPVLAALADSGSALTESLRYMVTFPFPIDTYANAVHGDYANGIIDIDLTLSALDSGLLLGTPMAGMLAGVEGMLGRAGPVVT